MVGADAYKGNVILPAEMRQSELTVPGVELHHYNTDDQLTDLSNMRSESVMEICLTSIGLFFGSIIPASEQMGRLNSKTDPIGIAGLLSISLTVAAVVAIGITGFLWYKRHLRHQNLAKTIRSRHGVPVRTANDDVAAES